MKISEAKQMVHQMLDEAESLGLGKQAKLGLVRVVDDLVRAEGRAEVQALRNKFDNDTAAPSAASNAAPAQSGLAEPDLDDEDPFAKP